LRLHDVGDDQAQTELAGEPRCNVQRGTGAL
jgi:hypothetical protein